jgi:hypothetical protein
MNDKRYVVLESKKDGLQAIKLTKEPYSGIIYSYGKVSFTPDEENDRLHLHFEYEIHDKNDKEFGSMDPFEEYIGDILQEIIHEGVRENSITYTGGVDEN